MKTSYDPTADAFYARFFPDDIQIAETKEVAPGVMIALDASGNLVGVEVASSSAAMAPMAPNQCAAPPNSGIDGDSNQS